MKALPLLIAALAIALILLAAGGVCFTKQNTYMKPTSATLATVPASKPVLEETIRPVSKIEQLLVIDGERVTIPKGLAVSASELASFIADRSEKARSFGSQARWAYYAAGTMANGQQVQKDIRARLETMLSKSAVHQLTSEATTLIPLMLAEGFNVPISSLKDAKGDLLVNEKTGKLRPMKDQPAAARELIPLLRAGTVSQVAIRDIRAKHKSGNAPAPKSAGKASGGKGKATFAELAEQAQHEKLANVSKYLDENKPAGDSLAKFVTIVTDIARKLGYSLTQAGAAPLATATVAKGK